MFISHPNNFNQIPMWNGVPIPRFGVDDDTRQEYMSKTPAVKPKVPGTMPTTPTTPTTPSKNQGPETAPGTPIVNNTLYNQGWLKTQIGKFINIDFAIGNMYIDRQGILQEVGISYIVIKESGTNDIVLCDIYSIKFVTVFGDQTSKCRM